MRKSQAQNPSKMHTTRVLQAATGTVIPRISCLAYLHSRSIQPTVKTSGPLISPAPVASGNTRRPSGRVGLSRGAARRRGAGRAGPCRRGRPRPGRRALHSSRRLVRSWRGPRRGKLGVPSLRCHQIRQVGYHCSPGVTEVGRDQVEPTIAIPVDDDGLDIHLRRRGASLDFGGCLDDSSGGIPAPAESGRFALSTAYRRRGCRAGRRRPSRPAGPSSGSDRVADLRPRGWPAPMARSARPGCRRRGRGSESDHDNRRSVDRDYRWVSAICRVLRVPVASPLFRLPWWRWPVFSLGTITRRSSPAAKPGNVAAKPMAEIDRGLMQR